MNDNYRHYLWTGKMEMLDDAIGFMSDKNSSFNGFDWCDKYDFKSSDYWKSLYQEMKLVRGISYKDSTSSKLYAKLKEDEEGQYHLKHKEVRGYADSWRNIKTHFSNRYGNVQVYITLERRIIVGSGAKGAIVKRLDAVVTFLTTDASSNVVVNIVPVEYKHNLSADLYVSIPMHISTILIELLDIYGAIRYSPDEFIDNSDLKKYLKGRKYTCVVHSPLLLFNMKEGAFVTKKFRDSLIRDLLQLICIENLGGQNDGYLVSQSPLLSLK